MASCDLLIFKRDPTVSIDKNVRKNKACTTTEVRDVKIRRDTQMKTLLIACQKKPRKLFINLYTLSQYDKPTNTG